MSERAVVELSLFTDDVASVTRFYRQRVGLAPEAEWPRGAVFGLGRMKLLVHARDGAPAGEPPNEDHVALGVTDVDRVYAELRTQGQLFLVAPRDYVWGRAAYLRDLDGRLVELGEL